MQTHEDNQHRREFMERLVARAEQGKQDKTSQITTGREGEEPLGAWKATNGMHVKHMPPDEQGILRISCGGGGGLPVTMDYLTVRGSIGECIELLNSALVALCESPE